ncbi:hypothetical protein [Arsenicicoccus sp. oral taxon 190]|uniref:hypothetical protein n=1 Tax=Arsenicicoccus sp. oral taxon 190 TaxID=1658671 RepID=UPI00067A0F68|nr:hypothetical protein [Arsenicicoccus sp. oral taxon 190]AKT52227.1 hypothetical protein ADJ73_14815 [Arsenicicoccus sp. oral taxon 190]
MPRRSVLATSTVTAALALAIGVAAPAATATPARPASTQVAATQQVATPAAAARRGSFVHQIYVAVAADKQLRGWKQSEWRVQRISVSTSGTWARATVHPTKGRTDDATVLLHKVKGTWRSVDFGTAQVGCGVAPAAVLRQLRLGGC